MFYRKDWILYQEVANEGGKKPEALLEVNAKTDDPETNKHVPFIEETANGYKVKSGKNEFHATDSDHHTMFIELHVDNKFVYRRTFELNEKPEVEFISPKGKQVTAYAFCNLHGLWKLSL